MSGYSIPLGNSVKDARKKIDLSQKKSPPSKSHILCGKRPDLCDLQERSSLASFSACGGSLLRQNSLPTHGDPRGAFYVIGRTFL